MPPDAELHREHITTMHDSSDTSYGGGEASSRVPLIKRKKSRGEQHAPGRTKSAPLARPPGSNSSRPHANRSRSGDGLPGMPRFPKNTPRNGGPRFPKNSPRMAPSPTGSSKDPTNLNKPKESVPNKPKEANESTSITTSNPQKSYTGLLEKMLGQDEKKASTQQTASPLSPPSLASTEEFQAKVPSDVPPKRHNSTPTKQISRRQLIRSSSGSVRRSPDGQMDGSKEKQQESAAIRRPSLAPRARSDTVDQYKNRAASLLNHSLLSDSQTLMHDNSSNIMDQSTSRMQRRLSASSSGGNLAKMMNSQQRPRSSSDDGNSSVAQTEAASTPTSSMVRGGRMPRGSSTRGNRGSRSKSRTRQGSSRLILGNSSSNNNTNNTEESSEIDPSPKSRSRRNSGRKEPLETKEDSEPSTRRMQRRASTTGHRPRSRSRPRSEDQSLHRSTGDMDMKSQEGDQQAETDSTRPARRTSSTEQSRRARSRTRREARAMSDNSKTGMKSSENDSSANLDTSINLNELRDAAQKHNEDNNNNTKRRSNSNSPTRNNNSSNNNSRSFRDRSRSPRNSPTRSRHYQGRRGRQSPSRQKSPSQKSPPRRRQSSRSRPRERSFSPPAPAETNNRRPGLAPPSGGPPRRASLTLESVFGREIKPKPAFDVLTTITGTSAESNDSSVEPESATTEVLQFDPTNATSVTSFVRDEKDSNTSGVFKMESLSESRHGESRHGKDREHNDRRSSSNQSYLPGNMDVSQRGGSNNNQSRSNLRRSSRRDSSRSRSRSQSRSKSRQRRRPSTSSYKDEASVARQQRRASLTLENVFRMEEKSLLDDSNADSQSTMAREAGYGSKRIRRRDRERNRLRSRDQQLDEKINNALLLDSEQYPYIPQNMAAGQSSKEPDSPLLGGDQSDMERSMGDSLASESSFATCDEDEAGGMKKHRKTPLAAMSYLKQLRRSSFVSKSQDSATTDSMLETSSFHESGDSGKDDKKESTSIKKKVKNLLRGKSKKHLQMLGQDDSEHSQDDGEIH